MFAKRSPDEQIDRYAGPYERWIFSPELGLPFAFPAIRNGGATHFAALMEGRGTIAEKDGRNVRIPPLWNDNPDVTPVAIFDPNAADVGGDQTQDVRISKMLGNLNDARFRINMPIDPKSWPEGYDVAGPIKNWSPPVRRPKVIIGVIDDGIPFMHRAFLDRSGKSRINLCWLQAASAEKSAAVPFGREVTHSEINALRRTYGTHEMRAYRQAGAIDRTLPELGNVLTHHATHGGHIAGIAAGNDRFVGGDPLPDDAQIIAVQLPNTIAWDTSGFGKEMMMLSAIEYIFHRARLISQAFGGEEIPLIVNFSYGWSANRHDGKSSFERAVQSLLSARKAVQPQTELVMPTGNNFAKKMHARFGAKDTQNGAITFGWHLKPDDRTSSYLEIWLPDDIEPGGWQVDLTPPGGEVLSAGGSLPVSPDGNLAGGDPRRFDELEIGGQIIGQLSADKHLNNRWRVMIALVPTASFAKENRRTPVGLWTIRITTGKSPLSGEQSVNVWVQRDDDPTQMGTGGKQSHLVDLNHPVPPRPLDPHPLSAVRGYGCLNGISTAPLVMRVAGYVQETNKPSFYSGSASISMMADGTYGAGPERPEVCAVADQGQFRPGVHSIGVLSGSGARIVGTSAAAAAVTRTMASNITRGLPHRYGFQPLFDTAPTGQLDEAISLARSGSYRVLPIGSAGDSDRDTSTQFLV